MDTLGRAWMGTHVTIHETAQAPCGRWGSRKAIRLGRGGEVLVGVDVDVDVWRGVREGVLM